MAKRKATEPDPQVNHEKQLQGDDAIKNHDGSIRAEPDQRVYVKTLSEGVTFINGHPLQAGTVFEMHPDDVGHHRDHGVALDDVPDDYDGEVYDVHTEWKNPDNSE